MSEMVERVARRLKAWFVENDGAWTAAIDQGELVTLDGHFDPENIARAAIEAMREPTEAMVEAARDPTVANGSPVSKGAHETWHAMIEEALK